MPPFRPRPQKPESRAGAVPENPFGRRPDLASRDRLRAVLKRFGLRADERFGQRFLADERALREIAHATGAAPDSRLVEIGAGIGNLTTMLLLSGAEVIGLEIDKRFLEIQREIVAGSADFLQRHRLVPGDALEFDFRTAAEQAVADGRRFLIAGNIPYNITGPLIMRVLETETPFETMTFLVQLEVAERLAAEPGSRLTSAFSVKVRHWCDVEYLFAVPSFAFLPEPRVHSAVIRFRRREGVSTTRPAWFSLVDAAFGQRRKTIPNALAAAGLPHNRARIEQGLESIGHSSTTRAEQLTPADYAALAAALESHPSPPAPAGSPIGS
jgi:16S rRNA (adenine1518-N6/adenine1519-N6)-dimethyltransferase